MKILVLGGGGREHALVWRLQQDPEVTGLLSAPGNPGIAAICPTFPVDLDSPADALALAAAHQVDLTVVGPEGPLDHGLADLFRAEGRPIVGPTRAGAQLECSKVFAKHFMQRHAIPTARFAVADTLEAATAAARDFGFPVVIKADGLAAGKGVVIAADAAEADRAIRTAMVDRHFGPSGERLVIEECLTGPEVSCFFLCDGDRAIPLSTAEDHKRIFDGDRGPNTGGMGALAPSVRVTAETERFVTTGIVERVLAGMRADGHPYSGFLYVSLMMTPAGPKVIEFNVRFGDPEAQVVLPLVEGPLARVLLDAATGRLSEPAPIRISADRMVGVVMAARGYPSSAESGRPIEGLARAAAVPGALVFHAGTRSDGDDIVTSGGRVLTVVGRGAGYAEAVQVAYRAVGEIRFEGMQFRRDIGARALAVARE